MKENNQTDKNLVLENIKATQARLAAAIKEGTQECPEAFPQVVYSVVERIESMDLTPFIDETAQSLMEAFDLWAERMKPDKAIGCVHLEYSYTKDDVVYAYGYEDAVIEQPSSMGLEGFVEIDYSGEVFDDLMGFNIFSFWDKTEGITEATKGSDYETAKMAEIFFHAMEKVTLSDNFLKLPKADEVTFALCRHDRWEIIAYVWKRI
jgi:hypothetical protein